MDTPILSDIKVLDNLLALNLPGDVFKAEFVGKVLFKPMLDLQDDHVLMQLLPAKPDPPR